MPKICISKSATRSPLTSPLTSVRSLANTARGGDQGFRFIGTQGFRGREGELRYEIFDQVGNALLKMRPGNVTANTDVGTTADLDQALRCEDEMVAEARLDGIYVVRISLPADKIGTQQAVAAYKSLALVERAFRTLKGVDMQVRPIYHWLSTRVKAHVFLCMLAYYIEHHMRVALAPLLFADHEPNNRERSSIVRPAEPSPAAKSKIARRRTSMEHRSWLGTTSSPISEPDAQRGRAADGAGPDFSNARSSDRLAGAGVRAIGRAYPVSSNRPSPIKRRSVGSGTSALAK